MSHNVAVNTAHYEHTGCGSHEDEGECLAS
nr:MAG TPA: hypothetical protein [Caudoviricetes sp.]